MVQDAVDGRQISGNVEGCTDSCGEGMVSRLFFVHVFVACGFTGHSRVLFSAALFLGQFSLTVGQSVVFSKLGTADLGTKRSREDVAILTERCAHAERSIGSRTRDM